MCSWIIISLLIFYVQAISLYESDIVPVTNFGTKSYFFGYNYKTNFFNAIQYCNRLGMHLVSIPTQEINDFLSKTVFEARQDKKFWTSGTMMVDNKNWIWLTTAKPVSYTNWIVKKPVAGPNQCIAVMIMPNKILHWDAENCIEEQRSVICETLDAGDYRNALRNSDSSFIKMNIPLFTYNDTSYYIGNMVRLNFFSAIRFCKGIGMELVSIESPEENNYLYKMIKNTVSGDTFWSGAVSFIDKINWYWLPTGHKMKYTNWMKGEPNGENERCIQLTLVHEVGLFWKNYICDETLHFICEVPSEKMLLN